MDSPCWFWMLPWSSSRVDAADLASLDCSPDIYARRGVVPGSLGRNSETAYRSTKLGGVGYINVLLNA